MPGEISRSSEGPKGGVPLIPAWAEKDARIIDLENAIQELHGLVSTLGYFFKGNLPHENAPGEFHSMNPNLSSETRTQLAVVEDAFKQADDVFRKVFDLPKPENRVVIGTENPNHD